MDVIRFNSVVMCKRDSLIKQIICKIRINLIQRNKNAQEIQAAFLILNMTHRLMISLSGFVSFKKEMSHVLN